MANPTTNAEIKAAAAAGASTYDYCVVYRRGGTDNFTWHRTLAMTQAEAIAAKAEVERGGRRAMVVRYSTSMAIGLPETYE